MTIGGDQDIGKQNWDEANKGDKESKHEQGMATTGGSPTSV